MNRTLQCGEIQYKQKLKDIRLLKFEVKRLRTEKMLLTKNIFNVSDLRQEVFHLNRDLARERFKVTALEEEIQTPLNIHRWRKLEVNSFFNNLKSYLEGQKIINFCEFSITHLKFLYKSYK